MHRLLRKFPGLNGTVLEINEYTDSLTTDNVKFGDEKFLPYDYVDFDLTKVTNYKSPKDIAKKGVFVPGCLYRFADAEVIYQYKKDDFHMNRWLVQYIEGDDDPAFGVGLAHISPLSSAQKEEEPKLFLCLETRRIPNEYRCKLNAKGKVIYLNRQWRTLFLYDEQVYKYDWYEDGAAAKARAEAFVRQWNSGNWSYDNLHGNVMLYGYEEKLHDAKVFVKVEEKSVDSK